MFLPLNKEIMTLQPPKAMFFERITIITLFNCCLCGKLWHVHKNCLVKQSGGSAAERSVGKKIERKENWRQCFMVVHKMVDAMTLKILMMIGLLILDVGANHWKWLLSITRMAMMLSRRITSFIRLQKEFSPLLMETSVSQLIIFCKL